MQAIVTKVIPPTDTRGARLKAACDRGSITIPYPSGTLIEAHEKAAETLCQKFIAEDVKKYGESAGQNNPWGLPRISGGLPGNGGICHVFFLFQKKGKSK